jgi:hypothetical protein
MSSTTTLPPAFARCACGSFSIAEAPCEENAELLLQRLCCDRCGEAPRVLGPDVKDGSHS